MGPVRSAESTLPPTVEAIAAAYLDAAQGDAEAAMRAIIRDALTDLCEAERRTLRRDRLISRGYVRRALDAERSDS
ncbi:hypothetical protein [Methylobacterium oxalidis]|nr:hypothetical protein [Methylobacterium oxalidis]GJE31949.1 hypothetical protein LDDCCGHA_2131 [Methylobacterium oxalidis]